jgi:carotenoid cleavage dioxygenase
MAPNWLARTFDDMGRLRGGVGMPKDLLANFAAVQDELDEPDLEVRGALPLELTGTFYRNGMNHIGAAGRADTWLLGDGMVHGISLSRGRATRYRNRWVRTDRACALLDEEPVPDQPRRVAPRGLSVANTHVVQHGTQLLALFEMCLPTMITPDLRTLGRFDFSGRLRSPMTSHPKTDPETGEMFFFGYTPNGPPWVRAHRVSPAGELCETWPVPVPRPTMMHDFAITENHLVFLDLPAVVDVRPHATAPVRWLPDSGARLGVSDRTAGPVQWFDIEPCYVFHTVNAFEAAPGRIVLDVLRYRSVFNREHCEPEPHRWTIDLVAGRITEAQLDDQAQEFPRIDDRRTGRPYRYSYGAQSPIRPNAAKAGGVVRNDTTTGECRVNDLGGNRVPSEPVFVSAGAGEDDGWLLTIAYDMTQDTSSLLVLDAHEFTKPPIAEVRLPRRVPFGAHGSWIPDVAIET